MHRCFHAQSGHCKNVSEPDSSGKDSIKNGFWLSSLSGAVEGSNLREIRNVWRFILPTSVDSTNSISLSGEGPRGMFQNDSFGMKEGI